MLDLIVAKALAKKPEERYQTAAELAAELRECGVGLASFAQRKSVENIGVHDKTLRLPAEMESTRALSIHFDSREATRRLAAATGTYRALEPYAPTLRIGPPAPSAAAPGHARPDQPSGSTPASYLNCNWQERLVIAASVIIAGIAALFIALA
jgi:serine/threonine-protein kinase